MSDLAAAHQVVERDLRGDRATYRGRYVVTPFDHARGLPVWATIRAAAQARGAASRYRWSESVDLGAEPPAGGARNPLTSLWSGLFLAAAFAAASGCRC